LAPFTNGRRWQIGISIKYKFFFAVQVFVAMLPIGKVIISILQKTVMTPPRVGDIADQIAQLKISSINDRRALPHHQGRL
jgi:hypothetical protein